MERRIKTNPGRRLRMVNESQKKPWILYAALSIAATTMGASLLFRQEPELLPEELMFHQKYTFTGFPSDHVPISTTMKLPEGTTGIIRLENADYIETPYVGGLLSMDGRFVRVEEGRSYLTGWERVMLSGSSQEE